MIADKILQSEILRLKILSANFKIQPRHLKFNRLLALNLATHLKFSRACNLNFIGRPKTWPAKQTPPRG
jgi:hypothetical protein